VRGSTPEDGGDGEGAEDAGVEGVLLELELVERRQIHKLIAIIFLRMCLLK
jgi:hypothetical protein